MQQGGPSPAGSDTGAATATGGQSATRPGADAPTASGALSRSAEGDRTESASAADIAVQRVAAQTHELVRSRLCDYGDQLAPWLADILCPQVASSPAGSDGGGLLQRVFPVLGSAVGKLSVAGAIAAACGLLLWHASRTGGGRARGPAGGHHSR